MRRLGAWVADLALCPQIMIRSIFLFLDRTYVLQNSTLPLHLVECLRLRLLCAAPTVCLFCAPTGPRWTPQPGASISEGWPPRWWLAVPCGLLRGDGVPDGPGRLRVSTPHSALRVPSATRAQLPALHAGPLGGRVEPDPAPCHLGPCLLPPGPQPEQLSLCSEPARLTRSPPGLHPHGQSLLIRGAVPGTRGLWAVEGGGDEGGSCR